MKKSKILSFPMIFIMGGVLLGVYSFFDTESSVPRVTDADNPSVIDDGFSESVGELYWVTSDRLNRRTCPSASCGVVGRLMFREATNVYEVRDGWARVSEPYNAACESGESRFVEEGNSECSSGNGIIDEYFSEWVSISYLSRVRPADPAADAAGMEELVAGSDDYRLYKGVFVNSARRLIQDGRCTEQDFEDLGGWVNSMSHRDSPVYFVYCGGMSSNDRLYLDASTEEVFR
ncbi:hypothetical protein [Halomonas sp. H5]|uniref:hypothetical protein n=1 Tax=Halomonas sp. H5 TaxID=3423910 RepID=UPI003D35B3C2